MSTAENRLFLPWLRRGLAGAIDAPLSGTAALPARPDFAAAATLAISGGAGQPSRRETASVDGLTLMGPGDIAGLGADVIAKVSPPPGTPDMFPNLFPTVVFHAPDLPWMFTPAAPNGQGQLSPWLALVCVEDGPEGTLSTNPAGVSLLELTASSEKPMHGPLGILPDPAEAWAWAHVQLTGFSAHETLDASALQRFLDLHPARAISRLVCPRNLSPRQSYIAALVPLFEAGRLAALGEDPGDAKGFAWGPEAGQTGDTLTLPSFHSWRFQTADAGDFESLARLLKATPLSAEIGQRPIDIQQPGLPLDPARETLEVARAPASEDGSTSGAETGAPFPAVAYTAPKTMEIGGALRPVQARPQDLGPDPLSDDLAPLMSGQIDKNGTEIVGPPLYGRWAAGIEGRDLPVNAPQWLREITLQARYRIAAGVGALLVRCHQDALMEEIWTQYGAIEQINQMLDRGRQARESGRDLLERHLEVTATVCGQGKAPPDHVLSTLAPVMSRIQGQRGAPTVGSQTGEAGLRLSPGMRRLQAGAPAPKSGTRIDAMIARRARLAQSRDPRRASELDDTSIAAQFQAETAQVTADMTAPGSFDAPPGVDWPSVNAAICKKLDPARTQTARVSARIGAGALAEVPTADPLHPIVAAPELDRPLYADLKALSQDWLLPGLDRVPENAISLLEPNPAFIEALMAGANHALGGEMLWRGFPTDRTATVLRQFWDTRGGTLRDGDIQPMTAWAGPLGSHFATGAEPGVMLLIRGDLLRRYPETLIYAAPGVGSGSAGLDNVSVGTSGTKLPLFRGTLDPDVTFLAFDLSADDVLRGNRGAGWFFMVEGPPTEPRFGLDETLSFVAGTDVGRDFDAIGAGIDANGNSVPNSFDWDPVYWGDLLTEDPPLTTPEDARAALDALTHVAVTAPANATLKNRKIGDPQWGLNAAHMAAITMQLETRLAFHASALVGGAQS